jgi:O-antigen ligase
VAQMTALDLYFFCHLVVRSLSNGLDRILNSHLSMLLSVVAVAVSLIVCVHLFHNLSIPFRVYKLIMSLVIFVLISLISFALNAFAEDNILSSLDAWYTIFQNFYLLAIIILASCLYRSPLFCRHLYLTCAIVAVINSCAAITQFLTGHTVLATKYDHYTRVIGLSAHPVTFSLEIAIILIVGELCRRKQHIALNVFHVALWLLALVALALSNSRTGVVVIGIVFALYLFARRPILLPFFALAVIGFVVASPFEALFSELGSVPQYISSGDFMTWDYRTATTSVDWRIHHWYYMSMLALSHPWFGFGPGQEVLYSPFSLAAHSLFVQIFFETGSIGLISYSYFWYSLARCAMLENQASTMESGWAGDKDVRILWIFFFIAITLVSLFAQSFNLETVSFSYLIVSIFVVLAPSRNVQNQATELLTATAHWKGPTWATARQVRLSKLGFASGSAEMRDH